MSLYYAELNRSSETPSLWQPLRGPIFRNLLVADVVSDIGAFMQSTGAAWLMVSLNAGPMYVALTQTASALPFFVFALPAGAICDIVDRRKLILYTEAWMVGVALALVVRPERHEHRARVAGALRAADERQHVVDVAIVVDDAVHHGL